MKIPIVFAHPEPTSFRAALKEQAFETIEAAGHEAIVSDLRRKASIRSRDGTIFSEPQMLRAFTTRANSCALLERHDL